MNVLVTGASGYIGTAVTRALQRRGHSTIALLRDDAARGRLAASVDRYVVGDIRAPADWLPEVGAVDGVIHTAATFGSDMAAADAAFVSGVSSWLSRLAEDIGHAVPFVYTGGAWLYGPVGDRTAVEGAPFDPPDEFAFMVEQRARLFEARHLAACVVHPAMVWDANGGALAGFLEKARNGSAPLVTGNLATRWPLVHRDDLADLYATAVEFGQAGADYHGVAERGVAAGLIAAAIARTYRAPQPVLRDVESAIREIGSRAASYACDQTMDAPLTRSILGWRPVHTDIIGAFTARRGREAPRWRQTLSGMFP